MPETHIELKDLTFPQAVYESLGRNFFPVLLNFMRMRKTKRHLRNGRKTKSVKQKSTCPVRVGAFVVKYGC